MSHRKNHDRHHGKGHDSLSSAPISPQSPAEKQHLEVVVKAESSGSLEAVSEAIQSIEESGVALSIIHRGIGAINKNDLLNATTGSHLIVGFEVDVQPHIEESCREQNVEIRLYDVIYHLLADLRQITASLAPPAPGEEITGSAKVIALFKSSRHGIILGCEVLRGRLQLGDRFRIITAMGPVYTGTAESLHIGRNAVHKAVTGQQVGLKIRDFNRVHIGDLVECFKQEKATYSPWQPSGKILTP